MCSYYYMELCISIYTELNNIIINDINKIVDYNKDLIYDLSPDLILILLNHLSNIYKINTCNYKLEKYEKLVEFIIDIIYKCYKDNIILDLSYDNNNIIKFIFITKNSHIYLKKIKYLLMKNEYMNQNILIDICEKGCYPSFLFYINIHKLNYNNLNFELLYASTINSDDRIFNYILINIDLNKINTSKLLEKILNSKIPNKYILRKIKNLSNRCYLDYNYKFMIMNSKSLIIINKLNKFYYSESINIPCMLHIFNMININLSDVITFYNNLNSIEEKNNFGLICCINNYYNKDLKIYNIDYKLLIDEYYYFLTKINNNISELYNKNNIILNNIFSFYKNNGYIEKFLKNNTILYNLELVKYTKFYINDLYDNIYYNNFIRTNKILHLLRCLLKKKFRLKENNFKINFKPIINEITNYIPNNKFSVLKKGSINYQISKQKFNKIPPRHLLPKENIINKDFLIKEKPDGILSYILPNNIYPYKSEIFNYEIKAEFIEELNLYLVFDINIPNTTIIERQEIIRSLHYATKNNHTIKKIDKFEEFITELTHERSIFNNFLLFKNKPANLKIDVIWYPKCAWLVNINNAFHNELIKFIIEKSEYNNYLLNNEICFSDNSLKVQNIKLDGLILTPLDGKRELKIKPLSLNTIDLYYNGKDWLDSYNNSWPIEKSPNIIYKNMIYRCYPIENKFIAIDLRYEKKFPNPYCVIDQIINICKYDWDKDLYESESEINYYESKNIINDKILINTLTNQTTILYNLIEYIKPEINKNWLDLGCGKCNLFKNIKKKYLPKKYLGIDNDIKILSEYYYLFDENLANFNIYPTDLSKDWNTNLWSTFNWNIQYKYIIINFSLMHFSTEIFWEQLNKITDKGSIIIFNLVKPNILWSYNNSFLKSNENKTEYKFEWIHNSIHNENLINSHSILDTMEKYNWKLIKKYEYDDQLKERHLNKNICCNELLNCYTWWIFIKN